MKTLLSVLLLAVLGAVAIGCGKDCGCGQSTIQARETGQASANIEERDVDEDISSYGSNVR